MNVPLQLTFDKRPLNILRGKDHDVLSLLFAIHAPPNPRTLDVTYNVGKMWRKLGTPDFCMDIDARFAKDLQADFRHLPFARESIDVIVYDPPHIADTTNHKLSGHRNDYGLENSELNGRSNISHLFAPFLMSAAPVLTTNGVIFVKLINGVKRQSYQWNLVAFVNACHNAGLIADDLLIKWEPSGGTMTSSKWKRILHLRNAVAFWIVVRKIKRA